MAPQSSSTLDQIKSWLAQARSIDASVLQFGRSSLLITFGAGLFTQGVMALSAVLGLTPRIQPAVAIVGTTFFLIGLVITWIRQSASRAMRVIGITAAALLLTGGVWLNGTVALTMAPLIATLFHLLLASRIALRASALLLAVVAVIEWLRHPGGDPALLLRIALTYVLITLFWQMASRFWFGWIGRVHTLATQIEAAVSQMDAERLRAAQDAERAYKIDLATGWLNRRGFIETLDDATGRHPSSDATRHGLVLAIRLHAWNSATAQRNSATTEALLESLTSRLEQICGPQAVLARTAPDSYLVWLPITDGRIDDALEACGSLAHHLEPTVTAGVAVAPTQPRIGIAEFPADGHDIADVVNKAETACTAATRRATTEPVRFYTMLHTEEAEHRALEHDVLHALRHDGFELHYQPLVSPTDPRLRKAEAFIRLQLTTRGHIPPELFIPLIEQTDLIFDLTDWVMREAAAQVRRWRATLDPNFQISINVPPVYLTSFARRPVQLMERLQSLDVPRGAMVLEITEGAMLDVTPEILRVLDMLRTLGFEIALDDFGVGYSHLSQLDKLRLNFLKLDKSFVANLGARAEQCPICEAIVTMAHRMGMQVVAEGVETETQRDRLVQLGTDYLQGYLYSKPLPAADLEAWAARASR